MKIPDQIMDILNLERCVSGYIKQQEKSEQSEQSEQEKCVSDICRQMSGLKTQVIERISSVRYSTNLSVNDDVSIITELTHSMTVSGSHKIIYVGPKVKSIFILCNPRTDIFLTAINGASAVDTVYSTAPLTFVGLSCLKHLIVPHGSSVTKEIMEQHGWYHYYHERNSDTEHNQYQLDFLILFPGFSQKLDFYFRSKMKNKDSLYREYKCDSLVGPAFHNGPHLVLC